MGKEGKQDGDHALPIIFRVEKVNPTEKNVLLKSTYSTNSFAFSLELMLLLMRKVSIEHGICIGGS